MADAIARVTEALHARNCRVRHLGPNKVRAQCPMHRDMKPSLAIDRKGDNVLLKCFAGCATRDVLDVLGLRFIDLREAPLTLKVATGPRELVARYEYAWVNGDVYARKNRFQPKTFRWERLVAPAVWRGGLDGLKAQLFGLEQLVDAKRIVLTEGEKSAVFLRDMGFVSACPPAGAGKWMDIWTEVLWRVGASEVIILPDADPRGRDHALTAAASCHRWRPTLPKMVPDDPWPDVMLEPDDPDAEPLQVKVVELPGLGRDEDVFDWLTVHRHTRADLVELIEATPWWHPVDPVKRRREGDRRRQQERRRRQRQQEMVNTLSRERDQSEIDQESLLCREKISLRVTRDVVNKSPVNTSQLAVLRACLIAGGTVRVADLVTQHGGSTPTARASVSRSLRRLHRRGLIERIEKHGGVAERRHGYTVAVRLTSAGAALLHLSVNSHIPMKAAPAGEPTRTRTNSIG